MLTFVGFVTVDALDRIDFPTSGLLLEIGNEAATKRVLSERSFSRHYVSWRSAIPVNARLTAQHHLLVGLSTGEDQPRQYAFLLGGMDMPATFQGITHSFVGLKAQERAGAYAQYAQIGLQYELFPQNFILARANAGNTFDEWNINLDADRFETGIGLTYGALTFIGPMEFTVMTGTRHGLLTHLNIGFKF